MKLMRNLLHPRSNVEEVAFLICKELRVKVSFSSLSRLLYEHPYYPSLLAVHDTFKAFGIDTVALKVDDMQQLKQQTVLVQIKNGVDDELFAYVYGQTEKKLDWYNPILHRREFIKRVEFEKNFTGYIMLFEVQEDAGEKDYNRARREEIRQHIIEFSLIWGMPIFLALILIIEVADGNNIWAQYIYALLLLIGGLVSGLLLAHEYNEYNPVLLNICGRSEKTNCSAVLHSKGSQLWGIPWSVSGTAYFVGSLSALLVSLFDIYIFTVLAFIHLLALPYVVYSIYYQKTVVKQWCPLCLAVQVVILLLFVTAVFADVYSHIDAITLKALLVVALCMFLSAAWIYFVWKYSMQKRESKYYEQTLKTVKYNPDVFQALLKAGKSITIPTDGYGITIGNPYGNIHIIKVCNPYCAHCADAQPVLQKLAASNSDVKLQMMFTISPDSPHYKDYPIDTFLSLNNDGAEIETILAEWYGGKDKDIVAFNKKHPVNDRFTQMNHVNAEAMYRFCEQVGITGTPTIFVNGHEMPDIYRVNDLKYFY